MALNQAPFKILEINVSSAQDLPPVSKMLRTFTVAWIHPDQKLSTRIDHQGHNNPAWNYKLVFRVDEKFLQNETAVVTFEIYNVAWLRDIPIGTAYLFINHISPPLVQNSPATRPVSLYIRRPTGHLQGILHVGVNLIDNEIPGSPLRSELSALPIDENQDMAVLEDDQDILENIEVDDDQQILEKLGSRRNLKKKPSICINVKPYVENGSNMSKTKSYASTNPSTLTIMHPLPSEVAFNLKKGFYDPDGDEYGSSVFENWSEPSELNNADGLRSKSGKSGTTWRMEDQTPQKIPNEIKLRSKSGRWRMEDEIPLTLDDGFLTEVIESHNKSSRPKRRKNSSGGGLFSCFGKGFEFTLAYGHKASKKNRNKIHRQDKFNSFHV